MNKKTTTHFPQYNLKSFRKVHRQDHSDSPFGHNQPDPVKAIDGFELYSSEGVMPSAGALKAEFYRMSITLITAIGGSAKMAGTSGIGAVNGALEIMAPILAKDFRPLRINATLPGIIDTPWWDFLDEEAKQNTFAGFASKTAVGRVGKPGDIAQAVLFVTENGYITGQVIAVEGGML